MTESLCETHLERGIRKLADGPLGMCRDCFDGKPTCPEEEIGGRGGVSLANSDQRAQVKRKRRRHYSRMYREARKSARGGNWKERLKEVRREFRLVNRSGSTS